MRVVAVVQARMGSSRLPGKVMARVGKQAVLTHVLRRVRDASCVHEVVVTTTPDPEDDAIMHLCRGAGVKTTRGQERMPHGPRDVLAGYALAARESWADIIVRITSDCPLIDPAVIDEVVRAQWMTGALYASNVCPPTWYDGCDVEVFTRSLLELAVEQAGPDEREHVTTWMRGRHCLVEGHPLIDPAVIDEVVRAQWMSGAPGCAGVNVSIPGGQDYSKLKLSIDDARDLERVRRVWAALKDKASFGWREVLGAYAKAYPKVAELRAAQVYGTGKSKMAQRLREAFVLGALSREGVVCPYNTSGDVPQRSAWMLGYEDAKLQGYGRYDTARNWGGSSA